MKILFVSHDVSRTGAPIMLLYFMKWLKFSQPEISFDLLSLGDGPLKDEFIKVSTNYYEFNTKHRNGIIKRNLNKVFRRKSVLDIISSNGYDLIYANSVVSLNTSIQIKRSSPSSPKLICHVHELALIVKLMAGKFNEHCSEVDFFIAASGKVQEMLKHDFGVDVERISLIYEFSGLTLNSDNFKKNEDSEFIVGGTGTGHWRKGTDVFVLVANWVLKKFPEKRIKFKWVGPIQKPDNLILQSDIQKLGISEDFEFVGEVQNPIEHFRDFDIFLLTSREDPFPLVAIEVAQMAIPIICFEGATGTEEILSSGGGQIVPYLDIEEMGKKIISYFDDEKLKHNDGEIIRKNFSKFTPELISPEIFLTIKKLLNKA